MYIIPFHVFHPALFFFASGIALTLSVTRRESKGETHLQILAHLLYRGSVLISAGIFLTIILNEPINAWGIFEGIGLANIFAYLLFHYIPSNPILICSIMAIAYFPFDLAFLPPLVRAPLVSGWFPIFPWLSYTMAGCLIGKLLVKKAEKPSLKLFSISSITMVAGVLLSLYSYIIFLIGFMTMVFAILFWVQETKKYELAVFKPLVDLGRAAFDVCFWRYPLIYIPIQMLGLSKAFPFSHAFSISLLLLIMMWLGSKVTHKMARARTIAFHFC